ncbi:hypothetical protein Tco_0468448 [Tanacetum coccineum]
MTNLCGECKYLQNSSGDFGPDLSFDKSASPEHLLRNALSITPKDPDHPFTLPAPEKELVSFINQLGCSKTIMSISALRVNDMYQPWRTLLTMINKCLTEEFKYQIKSRRVTVGIKRLLEATTAQDVILNGNKVLKITVGETEQEYEPTTTEEKQDRRNEMKARGTLLMVLPNKDQLKFHSYKDAKLLMEAIEKRYGGNKESKKVQRTLLEQQYENFARSSSEIMDQTFDSTNSNSSTNEADNTAYGVSAAHTQCNPTYGDNLSDAMICAFLASRPNSPQLAQEDLEQIDSDDLEEIDL